MPPTDTRKAPVILGPALGEQFDAAAACEAVLRSLPQWFGIESALREYAADAARLPTFAVTADLPGNPPSPLAAFITLREHFPSSWEVHCLAVHATARRGGLGRLLLGHAEGWLVARGARFLQVKTIAMTKDNAPYAETRAFYTAMGFAPLEIFPLLWAPSNPCLQMIKVLRAA